MSMPINISEYKDFVNQVSDPNEQYELMREVEQREEEERINTMHEQQLASIAERY